MMVIVNTKKNACSCILQRIVIKKNYNNQFAFKDKEKSVNTEKIANINQNVNSDMTRKEMNMSSVK